MYTILFILMMLFYGMVHVCTDGQDLSLNPLTTSPEYTRAGVYGKCVLNSKIKSSSMG